jgi:hypothetical protein
MTFGYFLTTAGDITQIGMKMSCFGCYRVSRITLKVFKTLDELTKLIEN